VTKIELVLAAFRRQDEEWKMKSENENVNGVEILREIASSTARSRILLDIQRNLGFHDVRLEQDSRVSDLEVQVTSLRIGLDGLENQVSSMELSRLADQAEIDLEGSDAGTGLLLAKKSGGVTFRVGQWQTEEHIQRVAGVEKQAEHLKKAHAHQMNVLISHGQQIGRLLSDADVLNERMNHFALRVTEAEKNIDALKPGDPERISPVEGLIQKRSLSLVGRYNRIGAPEHGTT